MFNIIKILDEYIEKNLKHYKEDWYIYDRPRVKKCKGRFILGMRDTGCHVLFIDDENYISSDNVYVFRYFAESTQKKFIFVDNTPEKEIIKNIQRKTAIKWCERMEQVAKNIEQVA